VSSEFQDNLPLWNRVTTSAELAQYWQEEDVMHLHTHTEKQRHLDNGLVSRPETTSLSGEEKVMPTVKHPENIHVWSLSQFCPKTLKKEWYQNALQEQLLPTVQERFVTMSRRE